MSTQGNAVLMGTTGPVAGSKHELRADAGGTFIGLDSQKRVVVTTDPRQLGVSLAHITAIEGNYKLDALGGGGSLTVDGSPVRGSVPLKRLHVIGVGGVEFVFRRSAPATPAPAPQPAPVVSPPPTPPTPDDKSVTAPRRVSAPLAGGTVVDGGAFGAIPGIGRNAPPANNPAPNVSTDPTNPVRPPLGTMIDAGGFGEITDPRQRKAGMPGAAQPPGAPTPPATPPSPPPKAPLGTMIDAGGLGEITDPRRRQAQYPPVNPPQPPAQQPPPAQPVPTVPPAPPAPPAPPPAAAPAPPALSAPTARAQPAVPPPSPAVPRGVANDATNVISTAGRPGDPSPYELMCALPGQGMQSYRLKYGDNVVGRSDECDVQVPDNEKVLSRKHAIIRVAVDKIEIVDLKGQNGTYVKGKRVDTAPLVVGASFHLGPIKFALLKA